MLKTNQLPKINVRGKEMYLYYCYGSNLNRDQLMARCSDAVPIGPADLPAHHLIWRGNGRTGVATVDSKIGSKVPGGLWAISERDLQALDRYEGYPRLYTRGNVRVHTEDGRVLEAMTYWMHTHYPLAMPAASYMKTIREGYMDFGLDETRLALFLRKHRAAMNDITVH